MKVCGGRVTMVPSTRISRLHCILALVHLIATAQGLQNTWRLFMSSLRNSVILTFTPMWPPCPLPNLPPDLPATVQMVPGTWKITQMFIEPNSTNVFKWSFLLTTGCMSVICTSKRTWCGWEFSLICVGSVDRRMESEESGDEEGKKQSSGIVADLSEHSLKDGEERGKEEPAGTLPS